MQIEAGKYYRDRAGRVHGPMVPNKGPKPWIAATGGPSNTWASDGRYYREKEGEPRAESWRDLVSVVGPLPRILMEDGRFYRRVDGHRVGPVIGIGDGVWQVEGKDEFYYDGREDAFPTILVAEWDEGEEAPPAKVLTDARKNQHGDWVEQARLGCEFDRVAQESENYGNLSPYQRKAVDMILVKLSRVLTGDADHEDHWDDIAGYAYLGKGGHSK